MMLSLSKSWLSSSSSCGKPKQRRIIKIRLLRNGDISFTGIIMRLELQKYTSFKDILHDVTEFMRNSVFIPTGGVRKLYTIDGRPVRHPEELTNGDTYVAACSTEKFKNVPYCPSSVFDRPGSALSDRSSKNNSMCSETSSCNSSTALRSSSESIQPRRITVIREGLSPRKVYRLLLNHRNAMTYEKLMATINDLICLDAGPMQTIFTQSGNRVNCLEDFFGYHYIFFAFHKKTNFTYTDFQLTEEEIERISKLNKIPGSDKLSLKVPSIPVYEDFEDISPQISMKYIIGETIGQGRYSMVKECYVKDWKESGVKLAMKIIYKNNDNYANLLNELSILKGLRHPNIIRLHYVHDAAYKLYLITELLSDGDLRSALKSSKIAEPEAKSFTRNIVSGLFYIHCLQIVHRDLKPSNLMITIDQYGQRILKLNDFRLACKSNKLLYDICGTTFFMAPEMLKRTGYDQGIDIWAAGVILYYMLVQVPPFLGNDEEEDRQLILEGDLDLSSDEWVKVSSGAKDLITNMLCPDPYERYSAEEVLVHPWISADSDEVGDGDWETDEEDRESKAEEECKDESGVSEDKIGIPVGENTIFNIHFDIQAETNNIENLNLNNITPENVDVYEELIPIEQSPITTFEKSKGNTVERAEENSQEDTNYLKNVLEDIKTSNAKIVIKMERVEELKVNVDTSELEVGNESVIKVGDTVEDTTDVCVDSLESNIGEPRIDLGMLEGSNNKFDQYEKKCEENDGKSMREFSENAGYNHGETSQLQLLDIDKLEELDRKCGDGDLIRKKYSKTEIFKFDGIDNTLTGKFKIEANALGTATKRGVENFYMGKQDLKEYNFPQIRNESEDKLNYEEINVNQQLEAENVNILESEHRIKGKFDKNLRDENNFKTITCEITLDSMTEEVNNKNDVKVEEVIGNLSIDEKDRKQCAEDHVPENHDQSEVYFSKEMKVKKECGGGNFNTLVGDGELGAGIFEDIVHTFMERTTVENNANNLFIVEHVAESCRVENCKKENGCIKEITETKITDDIYFDDNEPKCRDRNSYKTFKNMSKENPDKYFLEEKEDREGLEYDMKIEEILLEYVHENEEECKSNEMHRNKEDEKEDENDNIIETEEVEGIEECYDNDELNEIEETLEDLEDLEYEQEENYNQKYEDDPFTEMDYEDEDEGENEYEDEEIEDDSDGCANDEEDKTGNSKCDKFDEFEKKCREFHELEKKYALFHGKASSKLEVSEKHEERIEHEEEDSDDADEVIDDTNVDTYDEYNDDYDEEILSVSDDCSEIDSDEARFEIGMEEYEIMVKNEELEEEIEEEEEEEESKDGLVENDGEYVEEDFPPCQQDDHIVQKYYFTEEVDGHEYEEFVEEESGHDDNEDVCESPRSSLHDDDNEEVCESPRSFLEDYEENEEEMYEADVEVEDVEEDDDDGEWEDAIDELR